MITLVTSYYAQRFTPGVFFPDSWSPSADQLASGKVHSTYKFKDDLNSDASGVASPQGGLLFGIVGEVPLQNTGDISTASFLLVGETQATTIQGNTLAESVSFMSVNVKDISVDSEIVPNLIESIIYSEMYADYDVKTIPTSTFMESGSTVNYGITPDTSIRIFFSSNINLDIGNNLTEAVSVSSRRYYPMTSPVTVGSPVNTVVDSGLAVTPVIQGSIVESLNFM